MNILPVRTLHTIYICVKKVSIFMNSIMSNKTCKGKTEQDLWKIIQIAGGLNVVSSKIIISNSKIFIIKQDIKSVILLFPVTVKKLGQKYSTILGFYNFDIYLY